MSAVPISFIKNIYATAVTADGKEWVGGSNPFRKDVAPGASEWLNGTDGKTVSLAFACPCGCGNVGMLPVRDGFSRPKWNWDGSLDAPTLTPSVLRLTPCAWHGHLIKGVWTRC